jgi:hypothetical protein
MRGHYAALALSGVVACARGGGGDPAAIDAPRADAGVKEDAHIVTMIDAPEADAAKPIDARPVDATIPDGAILCTGNAGCAAGDCCVLVGSDVGFCTAGTVEFGVCFPSS